MQWWAWILVGVLLLGAELAFVDAEFYLVFLGLSALIVGLAELSGAGLPAWVQWLCYAVLSVLSMVAFRRRFHQLVRGKIPEGKRTLVGEWAVLSEDLAPGDTGRAELRGSTWTVCNEGARALAAGERARVTRVEGVMLGVRGPDTADAESQSS